MQYPNHKITATVCIQQRAASNQRQCPDNFCNVTDGTQELRSQGLGVHLLEQPHENATHNITKTMMPQAQLRRAIGKESPILHAQIQHIRTTGFTHDSPPVLRVHANAWKEVAEFDLQQLLHGRS